MSDLQALYIAEQDTVTAAILQVLGDQTLIAKFADKKVLFGVVTVAVNPGWRTQRGYAADVSSQIEYEYKPARLDVIKNFINDTKADIGIRKRVAMTYGLPLPFGNGDPFDLRRTIPKQYAMPSENEMKAISPTVAAVSPMAQSEVTEDQNSRRAQTQLALDLAGALSKAGLGVQATFFNHFANSLQQDIDSIETTTAVNTYSVGGGLFGFEVGPKLKAIANKTRITSDPADVLERQSFPAMIIIGFEDDDLRPRVKLDPFGQLRVFEPRLKLTTFTSWLPLNWFTQRYTAHGRLSRFQRFVEAQRKLSAAQEAETQSQKRQDAQDFLSQLSSPGLIARGAGRLEAGPPGDAPEGQGFGIGTDSDSALASLDGVLKEAIKNPPPGISAAESRSLRKYEREVANQLCVLSLPEASRDTARRYFSDIQFTQIKSLIDAITKSLANTPVHFPPLGASPGLEKAAKCVSKDIQQLSIDLASQIDKLRTCPNTDCKCSCLGNDLRCLRKNLDALNQLIAAQPKKQDDPKAVGTTHQSKKTVDWRHFFKAAGQNPVNDTHTDVTVTTDEESMSQCQDPISGTARIYKLPG